ncbi:hypothetical protein Ae201684_004689 [Aphanomyces euteiches]|uniref:Uncharacterized protein n=1 Tax=Aphanomyces euteiches TaxID=100861 RepID=A0A6G0XHR4_9STRA|nr:hypothetical protein Ae201684_004689 [Aphanomyces euteiches]
MNLPWLTCCSKLGYLYSIVSLGFSIVYVFILTEYTTNDHFWRNFNSTGGYTFLADVVNTKLRLGELGEFDIFSQAILKDYSLPKTYTDIRLSATRRALTHSVSFEMAVAAYRANTMFENANTMAPYCWVDFGHQYEMAHTAKRQLRCAKKLFDNAAAHMESLLRNTRLSDLMQSVYGIQINQTILTAVLTLPGGTTWVANLMKLMDDDWGSIPDEVAYWRSQGTTYFAIQYQNRFQTGNLNRIDIINALGITRSMTISIVPYISRSLSLWSTRYVNTGWWNDMSKCISIGANMLRNTSQSIEALGRNWDTIYTGATTTVGGDIVRAYVGPFMTWDTKVLSPPPSLLKMLANFHTQFYDLLRSDISFSSAYQNIFESDIDVVPSNWGGQDMLYYGGNPMCSLITQSKTYVQMPFSFDDACQRQDRLAILFARTATLFSMWISQPQTSSTIATSCNLSLLNAITCNRILTSTMPLISKLTTPDGVSSVVQDLQSLNLLFVQLASRNLSKILLTQPIIPNIGDPWSPFGWMTLYDWVDGTREAYAFEGDVGSLSLMSARSANLPVASNPLELPRTACVYFRYAVLILSIGSISKRWTQLFSN